MNPYVESSIWKSNFNSLDKTLHELNQNNQR